MVLKLRSDGKTPQLGEEESSELTRQRGRLVSGGGGSTASVAAGTKEATMGSHTGWAAGGAGSLVRLQAGAGARAGT